MPQLSRQIEGCAYNSAGPILAFRIRGMAIVIHPKEIHVHRAEDESSATQVIEWLKELLNNHEKNLNYNGELI
jgi:hypothetical protein